MKNQWKQEIDKDLKKSSFKEICQKMAMLLVIQEQRELQGSVKKPANNLKISEVEMVGRFDYFFCLLFERRKSIEEIEANFLSRRSG